MTTKYCQHCLTHVVRRVQRQELLDHDTDVGEQVDQSVDVERHAQRQDGHDQGREPAGIEFSRDSHSPAGILHVTLGIIYMHWVWLGCIYSTAGTWHGYTFAGYGQQQQAVVRGT